MRTGGAQREINENSTDTGRELHDGSVER